MYCYESEPSVPNVYMGFKGLKLSIPLLRLLAAAVPRSA